MSVGNEKLKELVKALDEVVEICEDVAKDGLDMSDLAQLPRFVPPVQKIYNAVKDIKALGEEAKDLDWNEISELFKVLDN